MRDRAWWSGAWQRGLTAWPGLVTLVSLLAVLLGTAPSLPSPGPETAAAGRLTPALPELRPPAAPASPVPLVPGTPPEPIWLPRLHHGAVAVQPRWTEPTPRPSLSLLGRRQTDGG
ncbi:hypothetical protein GO986_18165 [Deinococcus sp. HMF7620]|uniref:Uncharacterized protein n=1 Tax=Deinococcus arboris TaxID=2682977 RepID=A0A7C9M8K8_9DEIO|nr:hypothetical protein [Deinococcus arboris]MVN88665.1 hypothetical protein [Deinococcus arboris]